MLFRNNAGEIYNTLGVICNTSGVFSITPKETFVVRCELIKEANSFIMSIMMSLWYFLN